MSKPKAPKESAEQRAARMAEEERIRIMTARANADEFAAGKSFLTRRTRMVLRLYGARRALAGLGQGGTGSPLGAGGGSGAPYAPGYGGGSYADSGGGFGGGWKGGGGMFNQVEFV